MMARLILMLVAVTLAGPTESSLGQGTTQTQPPKPPSSTPSPYAALDGRRQKLIDEWVVRWQSFFGVGGQSAAEATSARTSLGLPKTPRAGNKRIEEMAHDFLNAWLVEGDIVTAMGYVSERAYACLAQDRPDARGKRGRRLADHRVRRGVSLAQHLHGARRITFLPLALGSVMMRLTNTLVRSLPKVLLHDHLDGGLRPRTAIELANDQGYTDLPTADPGELAAWFHRGAQRGSLPMYLEGFKHTCGVMQTEEALERVAYEMMEDMHDDGVVYVETRFAPVFHTDKELHWDEVVNAVLKGLERGKAAFGVEYGLIICAMRNMRLSQEMAELAVDFRERGVVGFDLAGEEGGFPPKKHIDAFHYIQRENFNITIHAGEAFGKESIWQAIQWCGAHRIGHATRLVEDIGLDRDDRTKIVKMGYLAQYILDKRIPLEICLSSNQHTGAVDSLPAHPFGIYHRYKFRVTLNTDDRLMSDTTMTKELMLAQELFGLRLDDFETVTINAMKSAFLPHSRRIQLIYDVIKPGYADARAQLTSEGQR